MLEEKSQSEAEKVNNETSLEKKPDTRSDLQNGDVQNVVASSGGMGLFPQPTNDELDPLNWSALQKNLILAIIMFK